VLVLMMVTFRKPENWNGVHVRCRRLGVFLCICSQCNSDMWLFTLIRQTSFL